MMFNPAPEPLLRVGVHMRRSHHLNCDPKGGFVVIDSQSLGVKA